jgi:hypothetical protein
MMAICATEEAASDSKVFLYENTLTVVTYSGSDCKKPTNTSEFTVVSSGI